MSDFEIEVAEYYLSKADHDNVEELTADKFDISEETVDFIMQCYAVDTLFSV
jgi:hypothetical protein